MNEWSRRRKRFIFLLVFLVVVVVVGVPTYFLFYKAPTCFDGRQNSAEEGVDCGGSCQLLCTSTSLPLVTQGDPQVLKIANGVYEVVALIENSNTSAEVYRADYIFRIYDAVSSIPLRVIEGSTFVPKGVEFAVFEGPFNLVEGAQPSRATFEWKEETMVWRRNEEERPEIVVGGLSFSREAETPRLTALVENMSLEDVSNIDLVVLISDETGSVFAASKTFIDRLAPGGGQQVIFSWPRPFESQVAGTEIVVRILPDRSFIR